MSNFPDWVITHKRKGTEIRHIGGHYYLYSISSKWNPEKKRAQKITGKIIGKISQEGFVPSSKDELRQKAAIGPDLSKIVVKEYGLSCFLHQDLNELLARLAQHFDTEWQTLVALAYCRLVFQSSIRQMPFHIGQSYLSELYPQLALSDKKISLFLRDIGRDRTRVSAFMRSFIQNGEHILVDLTHLPLKSEHISLSKLGYNSHMDFQPQCNVLYVFSAALGLPVFYRLLPGNIREVKAIRLTLEESQIKDCVLVADKGFFSGPNIEALQADNLSYIIPLRRNNTLIESEKLHPDVIKSGANYFKFEKRFIWHHTQTLPNGQTLFLFLDDVLKLKEEQDYLRRIEQLPEDYSLPKFHEQKLLFGSIAILTNIPDKKPAEIYATYKSRAAIESMFDHLKNILDADRSYMQNEETLQGWLFVNHLALLVVYRMYHLLVQKKIIDKYSINDLITHLKEIRAVKINDKWRLAETVKTTSTLMAKLNLNIHIP
jgi:transposase